jgi:hypothetical protein
MRMHVPLVLTAACLLGTAGAVERFTDLKGQPAPALSGSVWVGNPVSLDAVKGNAVLIAFWNSDAPC